MEANNFTADSGESESKRFLVALTYPHERRSFVRNVAEKLASAIGREFVFFAVIPGTPYLIM